ncbi:PHD finger protein 3 isoform X2 [Syngnathoides biaculeatus]|uniref:PHD finger protein 3 isoform X2 n=1 Tax=Syngnathoides biaculeatus TaxID=300417 RepID=UPI002ADDE01D|nr:PHD finger protein 3 isoform X2 [Syngnathoides biaculeatus]
MDIVDTFNVLIPSDQLDDTLIIGQNLECEASNEFGSGLCLEDSLKNMLSDKDPMFGCATSQFNLLDNEDSTFQISGTAGLSGDLPVTETNPGKIKRPVGRPRKRPCNIQLDTESTESHDHSPEQDKIPTDAVPKGRPGKNLCNRLQKSFLIKKGVKGVQLKKELTLGGRININDIEGVLWLKPSVVLKRLTVTIGGFKIELLPGPSYLQDAEANFDGSFPYGADIGFPMLSDSGVSVSNPVPEKVADRDITEKICVDETPLGLGPYVNPNDVQAANGTEIKMCGQEAKDDTQSMVKNQKPVNIRKSGVKLTPDNETTVSNKGDSKEKKPTLAKNQLQPKQPLHSNKKGVITSEQSSMNKGATVSQNLPSKVVHGDDLHKLKSLKEKRSSEYLKRRSENTPRECVPKHPKMQTGDPRVKSSSPVKKAPSSGSRLIEQHSPTKPSHTLNTLKADASNSYITRPSLTSKTLEELGQEKAKIKKPEKIFQKQKSKTARSISVDEPQLFIPDNAPVVKKESVEQQVQQQQEQVANSESVWDGNNCCGQCKKHHNNMFMVGCGRCDDWFHGDCVGLDLLKVREMEEEDQMYVCLKCCEEESKKLEPETPTIPGPEIKSEALAVKQALKSKPGASEELTSGGVRALKKEQGRRSSADVKETHHKTGIQLKLEAKSKIASSTSKKPASMEEIRRSVRDSLKEILLQRLKESDLKVPVEKASEVAKKTERELFHMYKDTENKYKSKYRSLMFNLKDTKNNVLFKKVLKSEISPANLIRMSPEELASKELAAWRQRENRHTIEMIEKEQREAERRPITKITHKGEIEIESEEPGKVPEPVEVEVELPVKVSEVQVEAPSAPEKSIESTKIESDTTDKHKSHLFDLNCKICTGRMAPPVKEAPTKVVKIATTVAKRQPAKGEEPSTLAPSAVEDDLHLTVLEESFQKAHTNYEQRSDHTAGRDDDTSFLSSLKPLWRGFLTMHSVAKLVTKAFPVSGILDNLTQDLPDSIQVGGRISPQTVWDYLEKIRATGTKEVCLIRFTPVTEEDEISYTLLYAYFSSRKRFGVVSNNRKQVKDMYLIPLGASEKVPHQLVPFDGPGLENNRANLLLGLIIRQRPKRDYHPVDINETTRMSPEVKPVPVPVQETHGEEEDEKLFLASLTTPNISEKHKVLETAEAVEEPITESFEEPSAAGNSSQESHKPLRFLPGVLLGWGGELPPLPDVGGKPPDDTYKAQPAQKKEAPSTGGSKAPAVAVVTAVPRERFVIKKKEVKPVQAEQQSSSQTEAAKTSPGKDAEAVPQASPVSLKDKPPDVSTEAFLESLATLQNESEISSSDTPKKDDITSLSDSDKGRLEGRSQVPSEHTNTSKPLSGILKKISTYSSVTENKARETSHIAPLDAKHASPKISPVTTFHQGFLQISQAKHKLKEQSQTASQSVLSDHEYPVEIQPSNTVTQAGNISAVQTPQAESFEASELQGDTRMASAFPACNNAIPVHQQQHQPQESGSNHDPSVQNSFHTPHIQDQNHGTPQAQEITALGAHPMSLSQPAGQPSLQAKEEPQEEVYTYCHPWEERQQSSEEREHHEKHGHRRHSHHGKKSRHHDRNRDKKHEHGYDDKHRDRNRHHRHSEDRYGEKRKERYYSDDYSGRHKERHRHRRDSDYDNGHRSSKDSYL